MMTFRISLAFIIVFLLSQKVEAQDLLLKGAILEASIKSRVEQARLVNKRNKYAVLTDLMGIFQIKANVGDTLVVSKLYYRDLTVIVSSQNDLILTLSKDATTLNEVVINGNRLIDDLRRDFKNAPPPTGKNSALSYVFSPLGSLYNLISTDGKNTRRFSRYYANEVKESQVDIFFNTSLVKAQTGLEGKDLEDFMVKYRPDYLKTLNWTRYDALKWIADCYKLEKPPS
jgi:hypothetical protein